MRTGRVSRAGVRFCLGGWAVAGLMVLVLGCAASDTAERPSGVGEGSEGGDPRALGVDVVDWPTTFAAASTLLRGLPPQIRGVQGGPYPRRQPIVAQYGEDYYLELFLTDDNFGSSPLETLVGVFDFEFPRCVAGTYAGTIPTIDGTGPHVPRGGRTPPVQPTWFSCRLAPTGPRAFMGNAVGWVSGNVGWLATARNQHEVQALVSALTAAAETSQRR